MFNKLMAGDSTLIEYYENIVLTKTGEQKMLSFHNTIITDNEGRITGILFSGEDITQHKQSEQVLVASEKQIRMLARCQWKQSMYGIDTDGLCTFANAVLSLRTLGYDDFSDLKSERNMHGTDSLCPAGWIAVP